MSAPASTAASTSSWRVSPHTFTSGRESRSRSFAPGSARLHQRRSDEYRVGARELGRCRLRARVNGALGDHDAIVARCAGDQVELCLSVDAERAEVPGVDADDRCLKR